MGLKEILNKLDIKIIIIVLSVLLLVLIVMLVIRNSKKKKFKKQLEDFNVRFTNLKTYPLTFKLNKVVSLAKTDSALTARLPELNENFETINNNFTMINRLMSEMDDLITAGKLNDCKNYIIDIDGLLSSGEKNVNRFHNELDEALKPENDRRDQINACKERFREIKNTYSMNSTQFSFSDEIIQEKMTVIEKKFSEFEDLMFANDFARAQNCIDEISSGIDELEDKFVILAEMINQARGVVPKQIDEVAASYSRVKQKGIYLAHLDIQKNLDLITDSLKNDLGKLRQLDLDNLNEHYNDYHTRLSQLNSQIQKEDESYDEISEIIPVTGQHLENMVYLVKEIDRQKEAISTRYGFEDLVEKLPELAEKNQTYTQVYESLVKQINENTIPASTILLSLKELDSGITSQYEELREAKDELDDNVTSEEGARNQLLKLQLVMNEIQVKIRAYQLPTVSSQYEGDLEEVSRKVKNFEDLLKEETLNKALLASVQSETIDAVYQLYNKVSSIVGMAQMVEDTIVFANKYRGFDSGLDSDLTRVELLYRNGEYTEALKTAINAVEKLNLESYQTLIKENAASAQ